MIKRNIALAALGLAISGAASAQTARPAMADERGMYIGAGIGQANYEDACGGTIAGFSGSCEETDASFKLFAGYDFNRMFAAEIGYVDLGSISLNGAVGATAASASIDAKGFELSGLLKLPITQSFSGFARLGVFRWDVDARTAVGAVGTNTSDTGTDLTYGLGLRYSFTRSVSLQAEWQRYNDIGSSNTGDGNVDVLGVSVLFKF